MYEVDGCKRRGCRRSNYVKVEDEGGQPQTVERESEGEEERKEI